MGFDIGGTEMLLEEMVEIDMDLMEYDPSDPLDIEAYWDLRLS